MKTEAEAFDDEVFNPTEGPLCKANDGAFGVCVHESCNTIEIEMGQPCPTCGFNWNCDGCKAEAEYNAYLDERVARLGPTLAMLPDFMECYECGRQHLLVQTDQYGFKYVPRKPVGLGPIAEPRRDPTQMYKLECGHLTM